MDTDDIEQHQKELCVILEKVEQARILLVQKLQPPTDGSPWDPVVSVAFHNYELLEGMDIILLSLSPPTA